MAKNHDVKMKFQDTDMETTVRPESVATLETIGWTVVDDGSSESAEPVAEEKTTKRKAK